LKTLFDKTQINNIDLNNRFVRSATWERMADENGHLTARLMNVYRELAEGEVGLIITGYAFVMEDGQPNPGMMGIYDDSFIEEYNVLTDTVHNLGSKIVLQIAGGGTQTTFKTEDRVIWGPSAVPEMATGVVAKEMTREEIQTLIKAFGDAAVRSKKAGFDGVQIHAAHGYMLSQFLNPYHNQRTDEYGGSIDNRARIIFEVYDEIRRRVGKDYPVMVKVNCRDFVDKELTFEESLYVCKELDKRGIDAVEVSGGNAKSKKISFGRSDVDIGEKEGFFLEYAAKIAAEINAPVMLVGGLRSPEGMEKILKETKIEYFSLARPFLREPGLIKRWRQGKLTQAACTSCNGCRSKEGNFCIHR